MQNPGDVTQLLSRVGAGETGASEQLFGLLYGELHSLAERLFRSQKADHTLQPTAVLHEAYMKLVGAEGKFQDRVHFFSTAARAMRQVLVNHARDRGAQKRGGGPAEWRRITLSDAPATSGAGRQLDAIAIHDALEELAKLDRRQAQIAELRFFGGLTTTEVAEALGIAPRTVELDWKMAKDWLARRLD